MPSGDRSGVTAQEYMAARKPKRKERKWGPKSGSILNKIKPRSTGAGQASGGALSSFLNRYKASPASGKSASTNKLGGIPKKKGAGR